MSPSKKSAFLIEKLHSLATSVSSFLLSINCFYHYGDNTRINENKDEANHSDGSSDDSNKSSNMANRTTICDNSGGRLTDACSPLPPRQATDGPRVLRALQSRATEWAEPRSGGAFWVFISLLEGWSFVYLSHYFQTKILILDDWHVLRLYKLTFLIPDILLCTHAHTYTRSHTQIQLMADM